MEHFWFSEALGSCDLQDRSDAGGSQCTGTVGWGTDTWTRLEIDLDGDDLLGSSSLQRLWRKGFNTLNLTKVIASHENAKNLLLLGSLEKENKIIDAKKEPSCYSRAWLSPWACPSLVPGALSVICSQLFMDITETNHIFQDSILNIKERDPLCV